VAGSCEIVCLARGLSQVKQHEHVKIESHGLQTVILRGGFAKKSRPTCVLKGKEEGWVDEEILLLGCAIALEGVTFLRIHTCSNPRKP
jgi:hypothetical protein